MERRARAPITSQASRQPKFKIMKAARGMRTTPPTLFPTVEIAMARPRLRTNHLEIIVGVTNCGPTAIVATPVAMPKRR